MDQLFSPQSISKAVDRGVEEKFLESTQAHRRAHSFSINTAVFEHRRIVFQKKEKLKKPIPFSFTTPVFIKQEFRTKMLSKTTKLTKRKQSRQSFTRHQLPQKIDLLLKNFGRFQVLLKLQ